MYLIDEGAKTSLTLNANAQRFAIHASYPVTQGLYYIG